METNFKVHRFDFSFLIFLLVIFPSISASNQFCDAGIGYGDSTCGISASSSKILIKGGIVVNALQQEVADVYVEDGIIVAVKPHIKVGDDVTVLDATGKYVMPGGIDPHTHLAMEFMGSETIDDFFTGQAAALAGGTTMHIDFIIPVNGSLIEGFKAYEKKSRISCMDYGFHMAITKWDETVSREMEIMVHEKGINSFKYFMAYKGSFMISDELLLEGLKKCKSLGALAMVHAENGDAVYEGQRRMIELGITGPEGHALSRPPVLEGEATARAIRLASFVNTPLYVVHVMSMDALEEIAKARKSGQKVIGEPVVSGLILDDSWLWHPDFLTAAKFVMSPPIRASGHNKALQAALSMGVLQLVGTDHCTFNSTQKTLGINDFRSIPNGVNGLEERMHLVWDTMVESGQISVTDYVRVTSTECARIFNIYPKKGAILVGSDADIIILNPNSSFEISSKSHHSRTDTNVYEGRKGKGKVEVTIAGGRIVWQNNKLNVVPGSGKYIEMPPFNYLFNGIDKADAKYLSSLQAPVSMNSSTSMRVERRFKFRNRKYRCGVRAKVMISDSRDNPYRLFFRCRHKSCKFFEWWSLDVDNPYFEEEIDGITSNICGHDGSSSNVGDGGDGLSSSIVGMEHNEYENMVAGFRSLRTTVLMLFVVVVILVFVIVMK